MKKHIRSREVASLYGVLALVGIITVASIFSLSPKPAQTVASVSGGHSTEWSEQLGAGEVFAACGSSGVCSYPAIHNNCQAGVLGATAEYSNNWQWWCNSPDGGTNVLCQEDKPVTPVPGTTCTDTTATNYGGTLPCTYTPTPATCTDTTATNYGGTLPCTYTPTPAAAPCPLPVTGWVGTLPSGSSVTAYQAPTVTAPATCLSETRICTNGSLSGSYGYVGCIVNVPTALPSASFTSTPSCLIPAGSSSCKSPISWTSANVTYASLTDCAGGGYTSQGPGAKTYNDVTVPAGSGGCYQIHVDSFTGTVLATVSGTAVCSIGTTWNGSTCASSSVTPVAATWSAAPACSPATPACGAVAYTTTGTCSTGNPADCTGAAPTRSCSAGVSCPPGAPSGGISATPNPCPIPLNGSLCTTTINWYSANTPTASVTVSGSLFSSNTSGSQSASWIGHTSATFILKDSNGSPIDSVFVSGTCTAPAVWNGSICAVSTVPPPGSTCTDTTATNYGGALPCTYPPIVPGVSWTNYCTGMDATATPPHPWQWWAYDNSTPTNWKYVGPGNMYPGCTPPVTPAPLDCTTPWGSPLASGQWVYAFQSPSVITPASCNDIKETRTCTNERLSGSYTNQNCSVLVPSIDSFTVSPVRVRAVPPTNKTTVSWSTTNVTNCSVTRNGVGWKFGTGGAVQDTLTTRTTYIITCDSLPSQSATVNVVPEYKEF